MSSRLAVRPIEAESIVDHLVRRLAAATTRPNGSLAAVVRSLWAPARQRTLSVSHSADTVERSGASGTRQADRARFHRLILPHLDAAYSFARFLSRDAEGAQDVVQEAALRAFRNFDSYQGGDGRAWLFAIVRNCHRDRDMTLRRTARFEVALETSGEPEDDTPPGHAIGDLPAADDTPEDALIRKDTAGRVRAVLLGLQEASREVLVLRELEGLSYREIAIVVGIPIGTVMSRLARARRDFARSWSAETTDDGDAR